MKNITPKKWQKKYCKKGFIICDGMTVETSLYDIFLPFALLFGIWITYKILGYLFIIKQYRKQKDKKE